MSSLGGFGQYGLENVPMEYAQPEQEEEQGWWKKNRGNLLGSLAMGLAAAGSRDPGATAAKLIDQAFARAAREQEFKRSEALDREKMTQQDTHLDLRLGADKDLLKMKQAGEASLQSTRIEATQEEGALDREQRASLALAGLEQSLGIATMQEAGQNTRHGQTLDAAALRQQQAIAASSADTIVSNTPGLSVPEQMELRAAIVAHKSGAVNAFSPEMLQALEGAHSLTLSSIAAQKTSVDLQNIGALREITHPKDIAGVPAPVGAESLGESMSQYQSMLEQTGVGGQGDVASAVDAGSGLTLSGMTPEQEAATTQLGELLSDLESVPPVERGVEEAREIAALLIQSGALPLSDVPMAVAEQVPKLNPKEVKVLLEGMNIVEWSADTLPPEVKQLIEIQAMQEQGGGLQGVLGVDPSAYYHYYAGLARKQGMPAVRQMLEKYAGPRGGR